MKTSYFKLKNTKKLLLLTNSSMAILIDWKTLYKQKKFEHRMYFLFTVATCRKDQFSCGENGPCIPLEYKCDNKNDCRDGSDEKDCNSTGTVPIMRLKSCLTLDQEVPAPTVVGGIWCCSCPYIIMVMYVL